MKTFFIKQNDTRPGSWFLKDENGNYNLSGASSVVFNMRDLGGTVKVSRQTANIDVVSTGQVSYDFTASDTDTVGTYKGEFEVTMSDATVWTWPSKGYIPIKVVDDIA